MPGDRQLLHNRCLRQSTALVSRRHRRNSQLRESGMRGRQLLRGVVGPRAVLAAHVGVGPAPTLLQLIRGAFRQLAAQLLQVVIRLPHLLLGLVLLLLDTPQRGPQLRSRSATPS